MGDREPYDVNDVRLKRNRTKRKDIEGEMARSMTQ